MQHPQMNPAGTFLAFADRSGGKTVVAILDLKTGKCSGIESAHGYGISHYGWADDE